MTEEDDLMIFLSSNTYPSGVFPSKKNWWESFDSLQWWGGGGLDWVIGSVEWNDFIHHTCTASNSMARISLQASAFRILPVLSVCMVLSSSQHPSLLPNLYLIKWQNNVVGEDPSSNSPLIFSPYLIEMNRCWQGKHLVLRHVIGPTRLIQLVGPL